MSTGEKSFVQFGTTRLPYAVARSERRTTVSILVDADHGVVLRAPVGVPLHRLDQVVRAKGAWIKDRLRGTGYAQPALTPREFVSGESFLYLGRQYLLRVRAGHDGVRLQGGHLLVGGERELRGVLVAWYREHARVRLQERVGCWAEKLGLEPPALLIREQRRRWGSCDPAGVVRLNWRVVQAPMRLVDYVVAHELIHLEHRDHNRAFWAALGRLMPDYEARREALRVLGPRLEW